MYRRRTKERAIHVAIQGMTRPKSGIGEGH
jgi:hypothetical protein